MHADQIKPIIFEGYARIVLPNLDHLKIEEKKDGSVVTQIDRGLEKFLQDKLLPLVPGSIWVGEETYDERQVVPEDAHVWCVDPIDGTASLAKGGSLFGTMVALYRGKKPLFAAIHRPFPETWLVLDDGKVTFNGGAVQPYTRHQLSGCGDIQYHGKGDLRRLPDFRQLGFGGMACIESLRLTLGLSEFLVTDYATPWDLAAPVAIHSALGGIAAFPDGSVFGWKVSHNRPFIMAKNHSDWLQINKQLLPQYWK
jgi:fructose-1,6-bisphosphatase/inositol monophosphatase family enzyme